MDTTNKYIEMCERAKDIQKFRLDTAQWQDGDFVYTKGDEAEGGEYSECVKIIWNNKMPNGGYHNWDDHWYLPTECIWLPRQDQCQEIMKESHTLGAMIQDIYWFYEPEHFCPDQDNDYRECKCDEIGITRRKMFDSIEQLWLAVVMDELYKKEWNGSEWILKDAHVSIASV